MHRDSFKSALSRNVNNQTLGGKFEFQFFSYLQSGSLTHSGPHPVMVSGLGINPGLHRQIGFPLGEGVQVVPGPQGEGAQGLMGRWVVLLTILWIIWTGFTGGKRTGTTFFFLLNKTFRS